MNETIEVVNQTAQNTQLAQQDSSLLMWIYCIGCVAFIYFFMFRPNKKRMVEYQKMLDSIKVGDRVLAAGIYGTVKKIKEKTLDMEIAKGVVIEVSKNAVANIE